MSRLTQILKDELFGWARHIVASLPDTPLGSRLRLVFYRHCLKLCGHFTSLSGLWIASPQYVSIGDGVSINRHVMIDATDGEIRIGKNVLIGPYSVLRAADHVFADHDRPIREQGHAGGVISIEEDCWLGSHVVVIRNVTIGKGSVVGAHSVVTKDIPPYSIAMGVPATVKERRQ